MKGIFVAASPFQLISAIEARHATNVEGVFVIFSSKNTLTTGFLENIAQNFITQDEVIIVPYNPDKIKFLSSKFRLLKKLKKREFDYAFIGHYSEFSMNLFACNLKYKKLFLLDDGNATLEFNKRLVDKETTIECGNLKTLANILKRFTLVLNGLKGKKKVKVNWFSAFEFKPENGGQLIRHQFEYLKSTYKSSKEINLDTPPLDDKVYFIGTSLVFNKIIKSNELYIDLIRRIKAYYKNFKLIYLPHRDEDTNDLNELKAAIEDLEIVRLNNILEVAFIMNNILPTQICSFYSTALYSLKLIFPDCKIDFVEMDKKILYDQYIDEISLVESYYKKIFKSIL
ncbi:MAG: hypothetical protein ACXVJP_21885 [Mucilaginibacter sp.]